MFRDKKNIIIGFIIIILLLGNSYLFYQLNEIVNNEDRDSHIYAGQMITMVQWLENNMESFIESSRDLEENYEEEDIHTWNGIMHNSFQAHVLSREILDIEFRSIRRPSLISSSYLKGIEDELEDIDYILAVIRQSIYSINRELMSSNEKNSNLSLESLGKLETIHELYALIGDIVDVEDKMTIDREEMYKLVEPLERIDLLNKWEFRSIETGD